MRRQEIPLVWDKAPDETQQRLVLFLDGHVETLEEVEFRKRVLMVYQRSLKYR
ncbi:MAG: hypothetical protein ACYTHN_22635 [Planctomycetota bacterium]|jgi:hypothetical protein